MRDKVEERRRKENNFLRLLYEETVGKHQSGRYVSITELCTELKFYPGHENKDDLPDAVRDDLFEAGREIEDIISNLQQEGLVLSSGSCNPYDDSKILLTLDGRRKVEKFLLSKDTPVGASASSTHYHINSSGGSVITGTVNTGGGSFTGRDDLNLLSANDIKQAESTQQNAQWRDSLRHKALNQLNTLGFSAYMEAVVILATSPKQFSQQELAEAASSSRINTFGWPVGIITSGAKPRPTRDGIINEVIGDSQSHPSYDLWALRRDGAFYMLQTLYEDTQDPQSIFFDTRIVRVTELFLYLHRLYRTLGFDTTIQVSMVIHYEGLKGRILTAHFNSGRSLSYARGPAEETEVEIPLAVTIEDLEESLANLVIDATAPLFTMFDYFELSHLVYEEIITSFRNGRWT